jgi:hypothetical protein
MKRLMIAAATFALIAGAGAANAGSLHKNRDGRHHTTVQYKADRLNADRPLMSRNVSLGHEQPVPRSAGLGLDPLAPTANGDLKYGPQPDYPQSPPGGGY